MQRILQAGAALVWLRLNTAASTAPCRWSGFRNVLQKYSAETASRKLELLLHYRIRGIRQSLFFLAQIYNRTILCHDAGGNRTGSFESALSIQTTGERG